MSREPIRAERNPDLVFALRRYGGLEEFEGLTQRQKEVAVLGACGHTHAQIGKMLGIKEMTSRMRTSDALSLMNPDKHRYGLPQIICPKLWEGTSHPVHAILAFARGKNELTPVQLEIIDGKLRGRPDSETARKLSRDEEFVKKQANAARLKIKKTLAGMHIELDGGHKNLMQMLMYAVHHPRLRSLCFQD